MVQLIVGLCSYYTQAGQVIRTLLNQGIARANISIIANPAKDRAADMRAAAQGHDAKVETGAEAGQVISSLGSVLFDLHELVVSDVGPIMAAGPLLALLLRTGSNKTAGSLREALVNVGVPQADAEFYVEGVRQDKTLLAIEGETFAMNQIVAIMEAQGAGGDKEHNLKAVTKPASEPCP
ncbi:MAG TPA: hypothetical protein VGX03_06705 [Candidatus Binatia bacterium]|jgi:hypothetical protein|nr:hypothetical protein [Candidatus Binatia bacterium]